VGRWGTHRPLVGIRGSGELTGPTTDREWGLGAVGRWGVWGVSSLKNK